MTDALLQFSLFHFLRPLWLILILPTLFLWWYGRVSATQIENGAAGIAPHLATALRVGVDQQGRILPIDGVALSILLALLAVAGPTWSRVPNPLLAQTAPLTIVLKVSESMERHDIAPSRLARAKHKIVDLLQTRAGARTALIAYAGTAHRVTPLSEDPEILRVFLEDLSPRVMPRAGTNATGALALANAALAGEPTPGAILFVVDDINSADLPALAAHAQGGGAPLIILSVTKQADALSNIAALRGITRVGVTPDNTDIGEIEHRVALAYQEALSADDRQRWDDRGWMLAWPVALLTLLWFRRGWTMRWGSWGAVLLFISLIAPTSPARADDMMDWFFTADQQARFAYEDKRFGDAGSLFQDPEWKGYALYRAGRYAEAISVLARIDTASAAFTAGLAHLKSRGYQDAIISFETALERDPDFVEATKNLEIARAIRAYVERTRDQSNTGEEGGFGADDVVYDNEAESGTETIVESATESAELLSEEQWMRTVDTQAGDFLRSRFLLEAVRRSE